MQKDKWSISQRSEREWWLNWKNRVPESEAREESIGWAKSISTFINRYSTLSPATRVLQIGPAANGEIHHITGDRYAIDPLASFYTDTFPYLMDPNVRYVDGTGEALPYKDSFFDAILIINVLDHCRNPIKVLSEIDRCLKSGGILILRVYVYSRFGALIHSIFNFADKEHPHAITGRFIEAKLAGGYDIKERSFEVLKAPTHNRFKKLILLVLKSFHLEPVAYKIVAIKK